MNLLIRQKITTIKSIFQIFEKILIVCQYTQIAQYNKTVNHAKQKNKNQTTAPSSAASII